MAGTTDDAGGGADSSFPLLLPFSKQPVSTRSWSSMEVVTVCRQTAMSRRWRVAELRRKSGDRSSLSLFRPSCRTYAIPITTR